MAAIAAMHESDPASLDALDAPLSPTSTGSACGGSPPRGLSPRLDLRLVRDVEAASTARRALEPLEDELGPDMLEDLSLLVTELVTNSVRHADVEGGSEVRVRVAVGTDRVQLVVEDEGAGFTPQPRAPDQSQASGWGLFLVEQLSLRWGVSSDGHTRVWLELHRPRRLREV